MQCRPAGGPWFPIAEKNRMMGNRGQITGCLIHRIIQYRGYKNAYVRLRSSMEPYQ